MNILLFDEESLNEMKTPEMIHRIILEFISAEEWEGGHEFY